MTIRECIEALEKIAREHGDQLRVAVVKEDFDDLLIDFEVAPYVRPLQKGGEWYYRDPPHSHGEPGELVVDLCGVL